MKFKLTKETVNHYGITLYHIEALIDFGNVKKGDKGGFIEKKENLDISGNAMVYGDAWVDLDAMVYGEIKLEYGYCFGRKRKERDVSEIENEEEILLIIDYKPAKEEKKTIIIDGKEIKISNESYEELRKSLK